MTSQIDPLEVMYAHPGSEFFTLPTGSRVYQRGDAAQFIYGVKRGIVECVGQEGETLCYRPGELFNFQDIAYAGERHNDEAIARTPVEIVQMDRRQFFNLLHTHPTLALLLISQQHSRLREQRTSGTCCY
jgi:CRP/FNR family cyclic AMP-dependent transcriptional regulator